MQRKIIIALLVELVFLAVVIFITMTFLHTTKSRSMLIGILCIVFNIIMYTSPLTVMVCIYVFICWSLCYLVVIPLWSLSHTHTHWHSSWQRMVIRTKSVKFMPFYLSLANFLNGSIWLIYALLKFDPYITVRYTKTFDFDRVNYYLYNSKSTFLFFSSVPFW